MRYFGLRKNNHEFFAVWTAHRWHPFKRIDRVIVLLVALCESELAFFPACVNVFFFALMFSLSFAVACFVQSGFYATERCCHETLGQSRLCRATNWLLLSVF